MRIKNLIAITAFGVALAACGGSGGGEKPSSSSSSISSLSSTSISAALSSPASSQPVTTTSSSSVFSSLTSNVSSSATSSASLPSPQSSSAIGGQQSTTSSALSILSTSSALSISSTSSTSSVTSSATSSSTDHLTPGGAVPDARADVDYTQTGTVNLTWRKSSILRTIIIHQTTDANATVATIAESSGYQRMLVDDPSTASSYSVTDLIPGQTYYFMIETHTHAVLQRSPLLKATPQLPAVITYALNDTGNNSTFLTLNSGVFGLGGIAAVNPLPNQDANTGRDTRQALSKVGSGSKGFDFTYIGNDGSAVSTAAQAACIRDNVTGLIWELKTTNNVNNTYVWKQNDISPYASTGYIAKINAITNINSACGTPSTNCTTKDYITEANTNLLCGANDWGLPTAQQLESIISLDRDHLVTRLAEVEYQHGHRLFAMDPMFNRNELGSEFQLPQRTYISLTPYWTASMGVESWPAIVDFKTGEVKYGWYNTNNTVENSRHAIRLVRRGHQ